MKNLLLPVYILVGIMTTLAMLESGLTRADDKLFNFGFALVSALITFIIIRMTVNKVRRALRL